MPPSALGYADPIDFAKQSAPYQTRPIRFFAHFICSRFMVNRVGWWWSPSTRKARSQALDRTPPDIPLKRGKCATLTHDYKGHGTTTLFGAISVLDGNVIGRCVPRHRHQEFIRFIGSRLALAQQRLVVNGSKRPGQGQYEPTCSSCIKEVLSA
jgi:hypothetical protein